MPSGRGERYDFFLSRRGSVAAIAREVTNVLLEKGYTIRVEDYDFELGASFIENMHEAIVRSRDLIILLTEDYLRSPHTRKEFTSFEAQRLRSGEERHVVILRCEDVAVEGLLADVVYQDLVGVAEPDERKRRIIDAAERKTQAPSPPPRPFIGVPPRIASFTGRAEELDRLDAILMHDKPAAVTQASVGRAAVQGMGGVGKTSLAIEYAHRFRGLYAGVCWCPAETRIGLLGALTGLAVTLGAATAEEADVEKAAKAALGRLAEQRATWLLVYDNVSSPENIADLLPTAGARVLITSRFPEWRRWSEQVALDALPLEKAVALLEKLTVRDDATGAKTLADALGCLPLALDHAAAYCGLTQMSFSDYAATASMLIAELPSGVDYPNSVAATSNLAIAEAANRCQAAETLMAYLAQCSPERIPMMLVEGAVAEKVERLTALAALAEVSLLKHDPFEDGGPAVTVHRLVQAVARARAEASGATRDAGRLIARLVAIYPKGGYSNPQSWRLSGHLTPHLLALREANAATSDIAFWSELLERATEYLFGRAAYSQAELLVREVLEIREKALGPEHPDTAGSLNDLAVLLLQQGDSAGARPLLERSLTIKEKELGPEHLDTAISLDNLASLLTDQGDFAAARPLYKRALAVREKALGPEHPDTAMSLGNLALLSGQGELPAARALLERALAIDEKALGPEHPATATCLNNLGCLLQDQGEVAAARPLHERALAIREKALGLAHPQTATSLNNLAVLLKHDRDFAEARSLYERALTIREKALGPEHPITATTLTNLAVVLGDIECENEAEPLFRRALAIGEKSLGVAHPLTQRFRSQFARFLLGTKRASEALAYSQEALASHHAASGPNHHWTKDSARVTVDALDALGRPEEAKALREEYGLAEPEKPKAH
jgi:tetratricopeptide (TPR) repeat protein